MQPDNHSVDPLPAHAGFSPLVAMELQDCLMTANHDMERLNTLLTDASDTLMQRFSSVTELIRVLRERYFADTDGANGASVLHSMELDMRHAVKGLQFQDMASQLIQHTQRQLRHCADRVASDAFANDSDGAAVVEAAPDRATPVLQAQMDTGVMELF